MPINKPLTLIALAAALSACAHNSPWQQTEATLEDVQDMGDGTYAYRLRYNVTRSRAVNADGDAISGPIEQVAFGVSSRPLEGQTLNIKYHVDEPVVYQLLEPVQAAPKAAAHDYTGYYFAAWPCASCMQIDTWVQINRVGDKDFIVMEQVYRAEENLYAEDKGQLRWNADKSVADFAVDQVTYHFAPDNGVLQTLDSEGKVSPLYTLHKLEAYAAQGVQLLLEPKTLRQQPPGFSADVLINHQFQQPGGYQSLSAQLAVNCQAATYTLSDIERYAGRLSSGDPVSGASSAAGKAEAGSVFAQLAEQHCSQ